MGGGGGSGKILCGFSGVGVITFSFCFVEGGGSNKILNMDQDLSRPPPSRAFPLYNFR